MLWSHGPGREVQQHVHVSQKIENKRAVYSR